MTIRDVGVPTLFERLVAILGEHRIAMLVLHRLERECSFLGAEGDVARDPAVLFEFVKSWRSELTHQFAAEESDAYFGIIATDRPALCECVDGLKQEHAAILAELGELLSRAESCGPIDVKQRIRTVARQLRHHEAAERALLHAFLIR